MPLAVEAGIVEPEHALVRDQRTGAPVDEPVEIREEARLRGDLEAFEQRVVGVLGDAVAGLEVEVGALLVERPERLLVLRQRTLAAAHARPGEVDADLDPDGERAPREPLARLLDGHGAAAERNHRRLVRRQRLGHHGRLELAELRLAALVEQLGDRPVQALDLLVRVHERTLGELRDRPADRRLPRAHEPAEREVLP